MKRLALLAAVSALVAVPAAGPAFAAPAPDDAAPPAPPAAGPREPGRRVPHGLRGLRGDRAILRAARMRVRARRFVRSLDLSEAQRATFREAREATAAVRKDARTQVRTALAEARKAGDRSEPARAALREKVRAVRASALRAVEPQAKRVLDAITPEQRAKIEERAKACGRTVDEARLLRRVEQLLLRRRGGR
jgi:Spy/CpxP family protein refolding chaperone